MDRLDNHKTRSISGKLLVLLLACILVISGAFILAQLFQDKRLSEAMVVTNQRQIDSISVYSEDMIEQMVTQEMDRSTELEAMVTDENFQSLRNRVTLVAKYASSLLARPEEYPRAEWAFPDREKNGRVSAMIMLADGLDPSDPALGDRIGLLANMSDMMIDLCETFGAENTYIALPEGVHLAASRNAGGWYQADGSLQHFDPRERFWYREAVEAGRLIFTNVGDDKETGQLCVVCAAPIYGADGELLAVAGSDFFLTEIQAAVQSVGGDGEFHAIVNQDGQVIFSPKTEGEFRPTGDLHADDGASAAAPAMDLRRSANAELAAFMADAMQGGAAVRTVELEDGPYYLAGAPIPTIGWTEISVFSQEKAKETMRTMLDKYGEIQSEALAAYRAEKKDFRLKLSLIVAAELIVLISLVLAQGRSIVHPLDLITERISAINGSNLEFRMDDAFRTGDEIEVLANSFADISHKTVEYVEQVRIVSAEKERISSELQMASQIQESVLPSVFPAFPDRPEIDIYAVMDPAKEVGGDFYDFFFIDPEHLALVIADVSGKGVPAALFMMISRAIIKNCAMLGRSATEILEEANRALCSENKLEMFVTVWIGILDVRTGRIASANAGHEYPVVYRCWEGRWEFLKDRHGFVLGGYDNVRYRETELCLAPGDKLFVYTDGVPEAENEKGAFYGVDRMLEALPRERLCTPKAVLNAVRASVSDFAGQAEQFDDLTMLCVEYKGPAPAAE